MAIDYQIHLTAESDSREDESHACGATEMPIVEWQISGATMVRGEAVLTSAYYLNLVPRETHTHCTI